MKVTPQDALRRLNSESNLARLAVPSQKEVIQNNVKHVDLVPNRSGSHNLSEATRDAIENLAAIGGHGSQRKLAEVFNISESVVSTAKTGRVGGKPANEERAEKRDDRILAVKDIALRKLMESLNLCTEDKLLDMKAKDLGHFAASMSKVVSNFTQSEPTQNNVNVVIYAPEMRDEVKYKTVEI